MIRGTVITTINCAPDILFTAITDVTLMGEWSPECTQCRWIPPASEPAVGARFEGDNVAKVGPVAIKKWTTISEVTAYETNFVFEFRTGDVTHWRFELIEIDGATRLTQSFRYEPFTGVQKLIYDSFMNRREKLIEGVEQTHARMKASLEPQPRAPQPDSEVS